MLSTKRLGTHVSFLRVLHPTNFSIRVPIARKSFKRATSTFANGKERNRTKPIWTTSRALALSVVTGASVYSLASWNLGDATSLVGSAESDIAMAPSYGSPQDMQAAIEKIKKELGEDSISTDNETLLEHGYSQWSTTNIDRLPIAVAYPKSTEEVSKIVKVCHQYRVPMKRSPTAKFGGMVGTNCSGTNAVRYGTMKDWVINLTVVLADGTIIKTRRRPRKSSAGYNLNSLFVGSEGTLGLVTEITLKLAVIPQETSVAVVTFPSIRDAAQAASTVIHSGVPVAAMEIMDEVQMMVVNKAGATGKQWKEVPTLFFKFSGTKVGVQDNISMVKQIAQAHHCGEFTFARTAEEQKTLWSARKESLWSMLSLREGGQEVWSTDVAVPLSRLADIIEISKCEMDGLGMFASILGHIGDGNFHESIMYDKNNQVEVERINKCVHDMVDRALEMDGTCTGEHGVGLGKKEFLIKELGLDTLSVMKKIKLALDPLWLLNPGKIIDFSNP
ncbi:D-lactate ferricytochrome c oxidoreductase [Rhizina undulata]